MKKFPSIGSHALGLYPVVDSAEWIKTLLPLGISTIQLRIKDKAIAEIEEEIISSIALAEKFQARLFINDYWELAIKHRAYGVHLGQEDLDTVDLDQLHQSGLRLGVSTHSFAEIDRALGLQPSYLAFGPIFPTSSKPMAFVPQGIKKLAEWCKVLDYPLVAIGGITEQQLPEILATGVSGVAVISAITKANDPVAAAQALVKNILEFGKKDLVHG